MADTELILRELREFRRENREKLGTIKEEIVKANARLDEAERELNMLMKLLDVKKEKQVNRI